MSSPPKHGAPRRRILKRFLLVAALLLVLLGVFHRTVLSYALVQGAGLADLNLEFSSLEGNFWSAFEVRDLRLTSKPESASKIEVEADSLRAEYSLKSMISGDLGGLKLLSCSALDADLEFPEAVESESEPSAGEPFSLPAGLPRLDLDVRRLRLVLGSDSPIELFEARLNTDESETDQLELSVAKLAYDSRATPVRATLGYSEGRVTVHSLEAAEAMTVSGFLELREGRSAWSLAAAVGNGRIDSDGVLEPGVRQLSLQCADLSLRTIASLGREPLESDPYGDLSLSLSAEDDGSAAYPPFQGDFALLGARFGDFVLESISSEVQFDGEQFTLEHLTSIGPEHEVIARATVAFEDVLTIVHIDELSMRNGPVDLALLKPAGFTLRDGKPIALADLELKGSAGHLQVRFDPTTPDCVELLIEELGSARLFAQLSEHIPDFDDLRGSARACWSTDGWTSASLDLDLGGLSLKESDDDYQGSIRFVWNQNRLQLEELRLEQADQRVLEANGSVAVGVDGLIQGEPIDLSAELKVQSLRSHLPAAWLDHLPATGDVDLRLTVAGTADKPNAQLTCGVQKFALLSKLDAERSFLADSQLSLDLSLGEQIQLKEFSWTAEGGHELRATGTIETGQLGPWWEPQFSEQLQSAPLSLTATASTDTIAQLSDWLRDWFGVASLIRSGHIGGKLTLSGTLGAIEPTGELQLSDSTLRVPGIPPITKLAARLAFQAQKLEIVSIEGELGAAPFLATATVDFADSPATLQATLTGKDLLIVRNSDVKVRCDVDLVGEGPLSAPLVRGDVTLAQGRLVSALEVLDFNVREKKPERRDGLQLFRFPDPPLRDMRFDVNIRSRGAFEIKNNVAKGSVRPDLHLGGTGEVPILDGVLYVDSTRVKLPANDITVSGGNIRFDKSNPFFPRLEIRAGARIKGYDVSITVLGPYDRPEVLLSSTPPLPDDDLLVLVLAGQLPGSSASKTGRAATQSVAVYLAKDYLSRWLSGADAEDEASWIERFDFQIGRDITRSGGESMEASFLFSEDNLETGDALFLTAESDQYDFINFGVRLVFRFQ